MIHKSIYFKQSLINADLSARCSVSAFSCAVLPPHASGDASAPAKWQCPRHHAAPSRPTISIESGREPRRAAPYYSATSGSLCLLVRINNRSGNCQSSLFFDTYEAIDLELVLAPGISRRQASATVS